MLQRHDGKVTTRTFFVTIEATDEVKNDTLENKISDALYWIEGTGKVTISYRDKADGNWIQTTGDEVI